MVRCLTALIIAGLLAGPVTAATTRRPPPRRAAILATPVPARVAAPPPATRVPEPTQPDATRPDQPRPEQPRPDPPRRDPCRDTPGRNDCPVGDTERSMAGTLLQSGPQSTPPARDGNTRVTAFIRNHWPFVVDFEPQPGTRTALRISLYLHLGPVDLPVPAVTQELDSDSTGGRQLKKAIIDLPQVTDGAVRIADYEVVSQRRVDGRWQDVPVRVFALGAGPRAVGSVTLNGVAFVEPSATIPPPGARADLHWSYVLKQFYDRVEARAWRSCRTGWCTAAGAMPTAAPGEPGNWTQTWSIDSRAVPGDYVVFVKAWLFCNGVTAEQYRQCGDDAAWAEGHADPIPVDPPVPR